MTIAVVWRKYLLRFPGSSEPRKIIVCFNIREINLYVSSETSGTTPPPASRCHVTGDGIFGIPRCENLKPRTTLETVTSENTKPETRRVFWAVGTEVYVLFRWIPCFRGLVSYSLETPAETDFLWEDPNTESFCNISRSERLVCHEEMLIGAGRIGSHRAQTEVIETF